MRWLFGFLAHAGEICTRSADENVLARPWRRSRLGRARRTLSGGQLQDGRALAFAQAREQHDLPVGEFQRIVVNAWLIEIDLPEARDALPDLPGRKNAERGLAFDIALECDLGAGQQAHRHVRFSNFREAAGDRVAELGRYQLVFDFRRSCCDMMEAVVTHRTNSSVAMSSQDGCPRVRNRPSVGGDLKSCWRSFVDCRRSFIGY